jgi:hypothetical protein
MRRVTKAGMRRAAGRALIWLVVIVVMFISGKKFHCVHTQGFSSPDQLTIDRDQLALSVFRQAQPKIE